VSTGGSTESNVRSFEAFLICMSDAIENEMHCTAPELTQIAANSIQI
jgi:hypothetical protein